MRIDGYRFVHPTSRAVMRAWARREPERDVPWAPLDKPRSECRVALITSAGLAHVDDPPFDQEGERRNPWWGDPTHRVIQRGVQSEHIRVFHTHIDHRPAQEDLDCLFPLRRLDELVDSGVVGDSAPNHYSIMGYLPKPDEMLATSVPAIIQQLKAEQVDVLVLVPS